MAERFFKVPAAAARLRVGPLARHMDSFAEGLAQQGYARMPAKDKLNLVAKLSGWLERRQLGVGQLDEKKIKEFLAYRKRRGYRSVRGKAATLRQLLEHLRAKGVIPTPDPEIDDSAIGSIQRKFAGFLFQERGLAEATVVSYLSEVQRFLAWTFRRRRVDLAKLHSRDINQFIVH